MGVTAKKLDHPYITSEKEIRNGEPIVFGTGIRVMDIAVRCEIMGESPEEIVFAYPHLNLSQIHDALCYYYENKAIIDKKWKEAVKEVETIKTRHTSILEKKLGKIKIYTDENVFSC